MSSIRNLTLAAASAVLLAAPVAFADDASKAPAKEPKAEQGHEHRHGGMRHGMHQMREQGCAGMQQQQDRGEKHQHQHDERK